MNKKFKKIAITILFSVAVFFVIDFTAYTTDWLIIKAEHDKFGTYSPSYKYTLLLDEDPFSYIVDKNSFRKPSNEKSKNPPIYIFGCSFAYGEKLNDNETFGAKLAEITNRPVYTFAYPGFSVQHMLYQLDNMDFSKYPKPKTIIYIYISDQMRRLMTDFNQPVQNVQYPRYELKNGDLKFKEKIKFSYVNFYCLRKIYCYFQNSRAANAKFAEENYDLLEKHFLAINSKIKEKFPNSQFIILLYNPTDKEFFRSKKTLEDQGIKVTTTADLSPINLSNDEYKLKDSHPSAKVWEILTPKFVEKTGLK